MSPSVSRIAPARLGLSLLLCAASACAREGAAPPTADSSARPSGAAAGATPSAVGPSGTLAVDAPGAAAAVPSAQDPAAVDAGGAAGLADAVAAARAPVELPGPADGQPPTLAVSVVAKTPTELTVAIVYHRREGQIPPRMAELWLAHSNTLTFVDAQPGAAAEAVRKQVTVQSRGPALERFVVFASGNTERMDGGPLVVARYRRPADAYARFELVLDTPAFAPADANDGFQVGGPLHVGTPPASELPFAPTP